VTRHFRFAIFDFRLGRAYWICLACVLALGLGLEGWLYRRPHVAQSAADPAGLVHNDGNDPFWASTARTVFHRSDCKWADKIAPDHRITYPTREQAAGDGREPCKVCRP
jgi:hypothetical protein